MVATAAVGAASGAVGNVANQTIRNSGFKDFSVKELVVSTVASGVGFGAGKLVSSAAANVSSNISSQAMQQTAQGAIVGGAAGASGSIAANVTGQVFDLARGKTDDGKAKENFDFGSLVKDTLIGGITGAAAGAAIGYGNSKFGAKISKLDEKVNNSIKQTTNKVIDAAKRILKDESGSVIFGGKGNNAGVGGRDPIKGTSIYGDRSYYSGGKKIIEGVDPSTLKAGNQQTLDPTRLNNQRNLIKKGIERDTLIKVTKDGVIYDGHHGARAALETGKYIDVEIVPETIIPNDIPLSKLPVRGSGGFFEWLKNIFR